MNDFSGIKEILDNNGVEYHEFPNYLKCVANWRGGDSMSSVTIYPEGLVIDHVTAEKYGFDKLVGKILNTDDKEVIAKYLDGKSLNFAPKQELVEPLIKLPKYKNKGFLDRLDKSIAGQSYWMGRGIELSVLKELQGGAYKNKYYFPIFNKSGDLLGWSARVIKGDSAKKYVIGGEKKNFVYPAFVCSKDIIDKKQVFLHEGIPDAATLMTLGVRNNLVLFGTEISFAIINYLLRIPDIEIVICQNNDKAGHESGHKIKKKLLKYFDYGQVKLIIPPVKDINKFYLDKGGEEVLEWIRQK